MDSRKPLTAGEISRELQTLLDEYRTCGDWTFFEREAIAALLPRLLSTLAQAQHEAAVLSRVIDVMGYEGHIDGIPEHLASLLAPRLTPEQVEAVRLVMDIGDQCSRGYLARAHNAMRAAFPEAFAGEVGRG